MLRQNYGIFRAMKKQKSLLRISYNILHNTANLIPLKTIFTSWEETISININAVKMKTYKNQKKNRLSCVMKNNYSVTKHAQEIRVTLSWK
jgi:hypothetical protein